MTQPSPSSTFQALFNAAILDYKDKTGSGLAEHPLAGKLQECDSVESITAILEERAQIFHEFRDHGKLVGSLKRLVDVLSSPFINTALGQGAGLVPFPPATAIFTGIAILFAAVKDVSASYDALVKLFASFERFLSRLSIYAEIPHTQALKTVLVEIIVELLSTLALATQQVKQGRIKKFVKKLRGEDDIEASLQKLDRLTLDEGRATTAQTLGVVYGLVRHERGIMDEADRDEPSASISRAPESMPKTVTKMNQAERDKLQQDVRNWLSPPDPWKNHKLARGSRHSGTGTWWIEGDAYADWKSFGSSSVLWIHGKPGAGKSVICSAIIEDICALQKSGLASLAFFYCDFREGQKKDVRGLLSSLLFQLGGQSYNYSTTLSDFYAAHGHGSQHADDDELLGCLKDMLKCPEQTRVHIIIDGLDECSTTTGMPSPRENVFELVEELVGLHIPNLRICVTSRPEADILDVLQPLTFRSVSLHDENGQVQDIAEYVKSVVDEDRRMRRWNATDKQLVIDVLTRKADGMFRYVFCQLAYIRYCSPENIQAALNGLPDTLDETYARTLEDIGDQNWERAHRLFQCVSVADRPLYVEELADILSFDFKVESTPTYRAEWRSEDPVHSVLSTCSSLLAVVDVDDSRVVQFAHFSVKEYLTSERLSKAKDTTSRFHVSMTPAHTIIAQACLGILLHLDENITRDSLKDFTLAEYAAKHWVDHARFGFENVSPTVQDGMKRLFDPSKGHLSVWVWIYDPERPRPIRRRLKRPVAARATPLHYAALCGLHDVAKFLIIEHSQDLNARGFDKRETPFHVASRRRHMDVAQLLLEHGADANARDDGGYTPLLQASREGNVELAQLLLKHGVDIEAQDTRDFTSLRWATVRGNTRLLGVLLEHGANVNARDMKWRTPLHCASAMGQPEVTLMLLSHGADLNARCRSNDTPLHCAKGEDVTRLLLQQGADASALGIRNRTPLHHVSELGRAGPALALLENGADANARDTNNATPLHLASDPVNRSSDGEYLAVVQLLIQYGSDIHAQDDEGQSPFMRATAKEHYEIMQLLLEHEA